MTNRNTFVASASSGIRLLLMIVIAAAAGADAGVDKRDESPGTLSLAEALRTAFERNWDLLAVMLCAAEWSPRRC